MLSSGISLPPAVRTGLTSPGRTSATGASRGPCFAQHRLDLACVHIEIGEPGTPLQRHSFSISNRSAYCRIKRWLGITPPREEMLRYWVLAVSAVE
jgi:hypothetical protein